MRLTVEGDRFERRARIGRFGVIVSIWVVLIVISGVATVEVGQTYLSSLSPVAVVAGVVVVFGLIPTCWLRQSFVLHDGWIVVQNSIRRRVIRAEEVKLIWVGSTGLPLPWPNQSRVVVIERCRGRSVVIGVTSGLGRRSAAEALGMLTRWAEAWGVAMDVELEELVFK